MDVGFSVQPAKKWKSMLRIAKPMDMHSNSRMTILTEPRKTLFLRPADIENSRYAITTIPISTNKAMIISPIETVIACNTR